jgi:hypothetical protein
VGGLVDRVVVAMPEREPSGRKATGAITDEVDDGGEFGSHGDPRRASHKDQQYKASDRTDSLSVASTLYTGRMTFNVLLQYLLPHRSPANQVSPTRFANGRHSLRRRSINAIIIRTRDKATARPAMTTNRRPFQSAASTGWPSAFFDRRLNRPATTLPRGRSTAR